VRKFVEIGGDKGLLPQISCWSIFYGYIVPSHST